MASLGGGRGGGRILDGDGRGGDGRFVGGHRFPEGGGGLGGDTAAEVEHIPSLEEPMRRRAAWENAWTSAGSSSSVDPISHYVPDIGLEPEMWELYVQFDGVKFVQKTMARSDIRYLNMLALMEKEGYGICDSMYYVKEAGEGLNGLALVDSNCKVEEMIRKYESSKKLVPTVMRDKRNQSIVVSTTIN